MTKQEKQTVEAVKEWLAGGMGVWLEETTITALVEIIDRLDKQQGRSRMASPKRLTPVERAKRKKIRALIRTVRRMARASRSHCIMSTAQTLDDLADVAENYLKVMKEE